MPIDPSKVTFSSGAGFGAQLRTQHMQRIVPVYPITDSEFTELKTFDAFATRFWSVGCSFITFAAGLVVNGIASATKVSSSVYGWAGLCGIIGMVFVAFAIWATRRKESAYDRIKTQSTAEPERRKVVMRKID